MQAIATDPLIQLADAKAQLHIQLSDTDWDAQVGDFVAAASQMIVNRVGPLLSTDVDEHHDGGSDHISLRTNAPLQSVTSVTESYGPVHYTLTQVDLDADPTGPWAYTVDLGRAVLYRRYSGVAGIFAPGRQNIHVTYVAGYTTTPPDLTLACRLLVQHMWETMRGAVSNARQGGTEMQPKSFYTMPRRVEEILAKYVVRGIG